MESFFKPTTLLEKNSTTGFPYDFFEIFQTRYSAEHSWKFAKAKLNENGHIVIKNLGSIFALSFRSLSITIIFVAVSSEKQSSCNFIDSDVIQVCLLELIGQYIQQPYTGILLTV